MQLHCKLGGIFICMKLELQNLIQKLFLCFVWNADCFLFIKLVVNGILLFAGYHSQQQERGGCAGSPGGREKSSLVRHLSQILQQRGSPKGVRSKDSRIELQIIVQWFKENRIELKIKHWWKVILWGEACQIFGISLQRSAQKYTVCCYSCPFVCLEHCCVWH